MARLPEFFQLHKFDLVIFTNYVQYFHVIDKMEAGGFPETKFIYDFFAPKLLENRSDPEAKRDAINQQIALKQRALRASSAILVNGNKKIPYVTAWLLASGADIEKPLIPTNFAIDPAVVRPAKNLAERDFDRQAPRVAITGHQQPWTVSGLSVIRLLQSLADNRWELFSCGEPDIARLFANANLARRFASLNADAFPNLPFDAFCERQSSCDVFLDVFSRTPERELAYVTRTAVALSNGLPAIHPRWTETGEIINMFGAGWLYESEGEIPGIIEWISNNPGDLRAKTAAAATLQQRQMNESYSTAALCNYIDDTPHPRSVAKIRRHRDGAGLPQTSLFLHSIFDPDWYATHFGLPLIDEDESAADYYERHASADRSAPNFLYSYVKETEGLGDLRQMPVERLVSVLAGWLDVSRLRAKLSVAAETACKDVVVEYFRRARSDSCDPNRFFSERFYLNYYPEVAVFLKLGSFVNGYDHYLSIGQAEGYLPSPFFSPEQRTSQSAEDYAKDIRVRFEELLKNTDGIARSPTPFFDPDYWQDATGRDVGCVGKGLARFVDNFTVPGTFGSAFHKEAVRTRLPNVNLDGMRTTRDKVLQQAGTIEPGLLGDLRNRLDAQIEGAKRDSVANYTRYAWALGVLGAYWSALGKEHRRA